MEDISEQKSMGRDKRWNWWKPQYLWMISLFYLFQGFYSQSLSTYQNTMMTTVWEFDVARFAVVNFLLVLPNYLKMFTGLLSDKVPIGKWGRRTPYIVIGAILYIPSFIALSFFMDYSVWWIVVTVIIQWAWVLSDGTLDALAVDITPPEKMGIVQGGSWAARGIGSVAGAVLISLIAGGLGWNYTILVIGAFAILQAISALKIKEPRVDRTDQATSTVFREVFSQKRVWVGILFTILINAPIGLYIFYFPFMINVAGYTAPQASIRFGIAQVGMVVGSLLFGKLSDKFGARKIIIPAVLTFWGILSLWFTITTTSPEGWDWFVSILFGFAMGAIMVPGNRISMEISDPRLGGFMFAGLSSISNFAQAGICGLIIGAVSLVLPLPTAFFVMIPFSILAIIMVPFMKPWEPGVEENMEVIEE